MFRLMEPSSGQIQTTVLVQVRTSNMVCIWVMMAQ